MSFYLKKKLKKFNLILVKVLVIFSGIFVILLVFLMSVQFFFNIYTFSFCTFILVHQVEQNQNEKCLNIFRICFRFFYFNLSQF